MIFRLIFVGALAALAAGCATLPVTGVARTGEQLSVEDAILTEHHTESQKVGSVQYQDENGQSLGKADVYQDVQVTTYHPVWYPKQGAHRIDDEDFFRIAGDEVAAPEAHDFRSRGLTWMYTGLGLLAGGAMVALGGSAVQSQLIAYSGVLAMLPGGFFYWFGASRLKPESHPFDYARTLNTATDYNQRLAAAPSMPPPNLLPGNPYAAKPVSKLGDATNEWVAPPLAKSKPRSRATTQARASTSTRSVDP